MTVDLSEIRIRRVRPMPYRTGGVQESAIGSALLQVDRLGSRWAFTFDTPPVAIEPVGRRWQALLDDAEREGGLIRVRQPNFDVGAPGAPVIAANTAAGRVLPLAGLTPHYAIRAGQWLSVIVGGRRYLDKASSQAIANAAGEATVTIKNLIRVPLTAGNVVELAVPKIEGVLSGDYNGAWDENRLTDFSFTVTEIR